MRANVRISSKGRLKMRIFKILLCGDGAVGKTSLRRRYLGRGFKAEYIKTIGADFATTDIELTDGQVCNFTIWDIAGQKMFEHIRPTFYTGASGACILYDITRPKTCQNVLNWVLEFFLNYHNLEFFPIVLLANKIDLREETKAISTSEGEQLAQAITIKYYKGRWTVPFLETSAKTGENVNNAFKALADSIVKLQDDFTAKRATI
jgi:small GTP-binding protein